MFFLCEPEEVAMCTAESFYRRVVCIRVRKCARQQQTRRTRKPRNNDGLLRWKNKKKHCQLQRKINMDYERSNLKDIWPG